MKSAIIKSAVIGLFVLLVRAGNSQGFVNLNFEDTNLTGHPPGSAVPATNAFPGWIANAPNIYYDTVALDAAAISLHDSASDSMQPLQGSYSVFLQGSSLAAPTASAAISQVGVIPFGSRSITFFGQGLIKFQMEFNNQLIPFSAIGSGPTYTIYGGDISAFAGQTGELLFAALPQGDGLLDSIQFSSQPVPEPTVFGLSVLAGLLLGVSRGRRRLAR